MIIIIAGPSPLPYLDANFKSGEAVYEYDISANSGAVQMLYYNFHSLKKSEFKG